MKQFHYIERECNGCGNEACLKHQGVYVCRKCAEIEVKTNQIRIEDFEEI